MHFIESLFGFAPDSGSGTLELCLISIPVFVVMLVAGVRLATNRISPFRPSSS
jgi:hypothetical protein